MRTFRNEQKEPFEPYCIEIQSQEEHEFLLGLFNADKEVQKEDCDDFNQTIDDYFYDAVCRM